MQNPKPNNKSQPLSNALIIQKLTALWALNEAALGGVLHVFKIPFTGLVIGSGSVILIVLIACFNRKPGVILRSTLLALTIKAIVSPYTPVNAYAAVFLQGILGEILFRVFSLRVASFLLGLLALLFSALQKFLVISLVFGMNLWKSIDLFGNYILGLFLKSNGDELSLPISITLILVYLFIHIFMGILVGLRAPLLYKRLSAALQNPSLNRRPVQEIKAIVMPRKKSKGFIKRLSGQVFFAVLLAIVILSYIYPEFERSQGTAALIMIIRSIVIMSLWLLWISPLAIKWLHKILLRKQNQYSQEIHYILDIFPLMKSAVSGSWLISKQKSKWRRINEFVFNLLLILLSDTGEAGENASLSKT